VLLEKQNFLGFYGSHPLQSNKDWKKGVSGIKLQLLD